MGLYNNGRALNEGYRSGGAWQAIYHCGQLVWELITGYIFTKSGRPLMTKSGRMLCTSKQLKK